MPIEHLCHYAGLPSARLPRCTHASAPHKPAHMPPLRLLRNRLLQMAASLRSGAPWRCWKL